ncbi:MAG TPA: nucleotidyltransferase family protein [Gallionellaceae bacterium]
MSDPADIAAIVLAAGSSQRFGANKLLHPFTQRGVTLPLAAHSLVPWLEACACTTVVVRPGSEAFCHAIAMALGVSKSPALRWLVCQDSLQGMGSSLACGVRANSKAAGWMIGLADMPAVPVAAIEGVRNALLDGADLSAAACAGRRGHPVGFARHYFDELQALRGDTGARRLIERDMPRLVPVEIEQQGIFADVDVPDDLLSLTRSPQQAAQQSAASILAISLF